MTGDYSQPLEDDDVSTLSTVITTVNSNFFDAEDRAILRDDRYRNL